MQYVILKRPQLQFFNANAADSISVGDVCYLMLNENSGGYFVYNLNGEKVSSIYESSKNHWFQDIKETPLLLLVTT